MEKELLGKFPWTRLGYTYDWRSLSSHIGLSEFVAIKGTNVEFVDVHKIDEYLQSRPAGSRDFGGGKEVRQVGVSLKATP